VKKRVNNAYKDEKTFKKEVKKLNRPKYDLNSDIKDKIVSDDLFLRLDAIIDDLKQKYKTNDQEIIDLIEKRALKLPLSVFSQTNLSTSEIVVKFLKEERNLGFHEIAQLVNRDDRTIWGAYHRSKEKTTERFSIKKSKYHVPVSVFSDRNIGFLEALSEFCHDSLQLKYSQIARIIDRDDRTVWTAYNRAKLKRGKK